MLHAHNEGFWSNMKRKLLAGEGSRAHTAVALHEITTARVVQELGELGVFGRIGFDPVQSIAACKVLIDMEPTLLSTFKKLKEALVRAQNVTDAFLKNLPVDQYPKIFSAAEQFSDTLATDLLGIDHRESNVRKAIECIEVLNTAVVPALVQVATGRRTSSRRDASEALVVTDVITSSMLLCEDTPAAPNAQMFNAYEKQCNAYAGELRLFIDTWIKWYKDLPDQIMECVSSLAFTNLGALPVLSPLIKALAFDYLAGITGFTKLHYLDYNNTCTSGDVALIIHAMRNAGFTVTY